MTKIAFIGLGNMGSGMAANQAKAGNAVTAFDLSEEALKRAAIAGCRPATSLGEALEGAEVVITMLPAGPHVKAVYGEILQVAAKTALLIDCSTIEVETAQAVAKDAAAAGYRFADAPVSGGTMTADAGSLAFMVGCADETFADVEAALQPMARVIIHAGATGSGQAAKICNNMLLGVSMLGTCEAFALFDRLGYAGKDFSAVIEMMRGRLDALETR